MAFRQYAHARLERGESKNTCCYESILRHHTYMYIDIEVIQQFFLHLIDCQSRPSPTRVVVITTSIIIFFSMCVGSALKRRAWGKWGDKNVKMPLNVLTPCRYHPLSFTNASTYRQAHEKIPLITRQKNFPRQWVTFFAKKNSRQTQNFPTPTRKSTSDDSREFMTFTRLR